MVKKQKTITKNQLYQLMGLLSCARSQAKVINALEKAAADIVQLEGDDNYDKGGYFICDGMYDDADIEQSIRKKLKSQNVKVVKDNKG